MTDEEQEELELEEPLEDDHEAEPDEPEDEEGEDEGDRYDEDDEDLPSDDEIAEYLAERGYTFLPPGGTQGPEPPKSDFDRQFNELKAEFGQRYAESLDDEERFAIQAEFQRAATELQLGEIEKQGARAVATAAIPSVQAEFAAHGLPPDAAGDYAMLLADLPPEMRGRTDAQIGAMQMALGRAAMRYIANPRRPQPGGVKVPSGESPGSGLKTPDSGLTPKELSTLKSLFPKVKFTPAKIAELRREGIL